MADGSIHYFGEKTLFEPTPLASFLRDHGIHATPVVSEEPELEPHTIELPHGLSIVFNDGTLSLQREIAHGYIDLGEFSSITVLVDIIKETIEDAE